jgi:hypothetical protein
VAKRSGERLRQAGEHGQVSMKLDLRQSSAGAEQVDKDVIRLRLWGAKTQVGRGSDRFCGRTLVLGRDTPSIIFMC